MTVTYSRRKPIHKRLPLPPRVLGDQFTPVDVEIGLWDYGPVRLRFDLYSQTWRARLKGDGWQIGEYPRNATANEIAAALDAATGNQKAAGEGG